MLFFIQSSPSKDDKRSITLGPSLTLRNFTAGAGLGWRIIAYQQLIDPINGFLLNGALTVIVRVKVITELKYCDVQYTGYCSKRYEDSIV
jgi:hypothetical protein